MRSGQQKQRGRGRNNGGNNRKGGNPLSRSYDSTGPDVKVRGTAQQIADKYANLARDAQSAGDNVIAENYLQHAEHYNRIIAAAQAQMQERYQRNERDGTDRDQDDETEDHGGNRDERQSRQVHREDRRREGVRDNGSTHDEDDSEPDNKALRRNDTKAERDEDAGDSVSASGTGPQPTIEGTPAEVSMEEEAAGATAGRRAPRRRTAAPRPRRPRTKAAADGDEKTDKPAAKKDSDTVAMTAGE